MLQVAVALYKNRQYMTSSFFFFKRQKSEAPRAAHNLLLKYKIFGVWVYVVDGGRSFRKVVDEKSLPILRA